MQYAQLDLLPISLVSMNLLPEIVHSSYQYIILFQCYSLGWTFRLSRDIYSMDP
jgi:hypothetical protein